MLKTRFWEIGSNPSFFSDAETIFLIYRKMTYIFTPSYGQGMIWANLLTTLFLHVFVHILPNTC